MRMRIKTRLQVALGTVLLTKHPGFVGLNGPLTEVPEHFGLYHRGISNCPWSKTMACQRRDSPTLGRFRSAFMCGVIALVGSSCIHAPYPETWPQPPETDQGACSRLGGSIQARGEDAQGREWSLTSVLGTGFRGHFSRFTFSFREAGRLAIEATGIDGSVSDFQTFEYRCQPESVVLDGQSRWAAAGQLPVAMHQRLTYRLIPTQDHLIVKREYLGRGVALFVPFAVRRGDWFHFEWVPADDQQSPK